MAVTFNKDILRPIFPQDAFLNWAALYGPEGASQTFVYGDVLELASNYLQICGSPAGGASNRLWGIALQDGNNGSAGANNIKYFPILPGACAHVNVLTTAAADFVLTAAQMGGQYELTRSATLVGGTDPGWYLNTALAVVKSNTIVSFFGDQPTTSSYAQEARVGDTNARVMICFQAAETAFTL